MSTITFSEVKLNEVKSHQCFQYNDIISCQELSVIIRTFGQNNVIDEIIELLTTRFQRELRSSLPEELPSMLASQGSVAECWVKDMITKGAEVRTSSRPYTPTGFLNPDGSNEEIKSPAG